jgi:hypothetical protein
VTKDETEDRLERIAELAQLLRDEAHGLRTETDGVLSRLSRRAQVNRRMLWIVIVSLALDLALSVVLAVALVQVSRNDRSIGALTDRLDTQQTTTRRNSLCPLYTLLKDGDTASARAAAPDKAAYDHATQVIRDGYKALGCVQFVPVAPTAGPTAG